MWHNNAQPVHESAIGKVGFRRSPRGSNYRVSVLSGNFRVRGGRDWQPSSSVGDGAESSSDTGSRERSVTLATSINAGGSGAAQASYGSSIWSPSLP